MRRRVGELAAESQRSCRPLGRLALGAQCRPVEAVSMGGTAVRWEEPGGGHSRAQRRRLPVRGEMMARSLGKAWGRVELDLAAC